MSSSTNNPPITLSPGTSIGPLRAAWLTAPSMKTSAVSPRSPSTRDRYGWAIATRPSACSRATWASASSRRAGAVAGRVEGAARHASASPRSPRPSGQSIASPGAANAVGTTGTPAAARSCM